MPGFRSDGSRSESSGPTAGMKLTWVMRSAALVILIPLIAYSASSQLKWEKAAWVTGSAVALGVYDYIGYNLTYSDPTALSVYRVTFVLLQVGLTYLLYEKFGLPSAIGLNIIWWTFGVDMVYYGISEVNPIRGDGWAGPGSWERDSRYGVKHADWTPVGLIRGKDPIPGNTIIAQSIAGAFIGIGISISF